MFEVSVDSGDVLGLRFSSQFAAQAAGDHALAPVSRSLQQQEQLQDPEWPQQASGSCSGCQRRRRATLSQVLTHRPNLLRKVQTGRIHTSSSAEMLSQSAPNVSVARNMRQTFTDHHELRR